MFNKEQDNGKFQCNVFIVFVVWWCMW